MPDHIHIQNLVIQSHVGVPDEERANSQKLTVSITMEPNASFVSLGDRIENTIDYAAVCEVVKAVAEAKPRRLIETLAEDIAQTLLGQFAIWKLSLELRKFILPDTDYVAIRIDRPVS